MTPEVILDIFQHMLYLIIVGAGIVIVPGLAVGLIIAVFQAATQVNEMTLNFFPKLVVMLIVLAMVAPWLMQHLVVYFQALITDIPMLIGVR